MNELSHKEIPFRSVLIYGMGMMGASLALALRASDHYSGKITGVVRTQRSAAFIEQHGMADSVVIEPDLDRIGSLPLEDYDLIVFGLPVKSIVRVFEIFPSYSGLITDMSSTRSEVHEAAAQRRELRFVGSHPMCGSEDQGPMAARADLFHNRLCIITEDTVSGNRDDDRKAVEDFWKAVGMKTYSMKPAAHDEVLAYLSHAPHILSGLLASWAAGAVAVDRSTNESPVPITGGGFRDMARIAGSNPEMWTDILFTNKKFILESLEVFSQELESVKKQLEKSDRQWWLDWFSSARKARNRLCGYPEDR